MKYIHSPQTWVIATLKYILIQFFLLLAFISATNAQEKDICMTHQDLVQQVFEKSNAPKNKNPEFRITRAEDGQSLIYWHLGGKTGSFFAVTFKEDGCAILNSNGDLRRFTFPKTAFNTGVFFEMDVFDYKL